MRRRCFCFMAVLAVLLSGSPAAAATYEARLALSEGRRLLLAQWLAQDCTDDSANLVLKLRKEGPALEAALWEAYSLGPDASQEAAFAASLPATFDARRRWLLEYGIKAVGEDAAELLSAETPEEYTADELRRFRIRWRDAALAGLGRICTPGALKRLAAVAFDKESPHARVARLGIAGCRP